MSSDSTAGPATPDGRGAAGSAPTTRASRTHAARQRRRRRTVVLTVAVLTAVGIATGGVLALSGGGDDPAVAPSPARRSTTTSTSTTTTTTAPVATTAVPKSADPVVALAQQYDGRYVGTWTNTTFGTTGPATLELRIDPAEGTVTVDADFEGDLFGNEARTRRITGTVKLGDPNAVITTQTKAFGAVTGRLDQALAVILTAPDVPEPNVQSFELTGRLREDNTGFDATFSIQHRDGSSSTGTVTVLCDPSGQRGTEVTTVCALSG